MVYRTSNPAFSNYFWEDQRSPESKMTIRGILIKSLVLLFIISAITAFVWELHSQGFSIKWYATGGMLASIVISIVISIRNHWAHFLVPLYAIAKGFFVGGISAYAHAKFPNIPYQAVI
ncbi:MAG: Bax inhibitor-1/YccA family protein, partial [Bacteroidia bacterium]|nr:Bax inhibitor-1/YccA family protein [Bacteroidia bacterium]